MFRFYTRSLLLAFAMASMAVVMVHAASGQKIVLVDNGQSRFVIHRSESAPKSVRTAANELQRCLRMATGCALPVEDKPTKSMIVLGDCKAARAAGIAPAALRDEEFHIATAGGCVFIVGKDTPDGETTSRGGKSQGTLLGVYAFLEHVVGVRWIMPGALGEIVPHHQRLVCPSMDFTEGPSFAARELELSDPPLVREWALRNRVGTQPGESGALVVNADHAWNEVMPLALREAHPEWAAVHPYQEKPNYKFCTRNAEAVAAFTRSFMGKVSDKPDSFMLSAAPSDGQSFCHCDQCKAHIFMNPHGKEATTVNLLDLYNGIARALPSKATQPMVGGLVYGANAYPPVTPVEIDARVFLLWAPLDVYGLALYKDGYRTEFDRLAQRWREITPNLGYSNYLHWHRSKGAAPLAPAPELMKLEFATLKKHGFQSVHEAVDPNWAYAGPNNWLLARLMWNASADVDALYDEWLTLAYGEGASAMGRIYSLIDDAFRDYKQHVEPFHFSDGQYDIEHKKLTHIYLPLLPRIDVLYAESLAATTDLRARQRIELFGDTMRFFHHELKRAGYVKPDNVSIFTMSDEAFAKFASSPESAGSPPSRYYMVKALPLPLAR